MSAEAVAAALVSPSQPPQAAGGEGARVASAFDSAVLAARQEFDTRAQGVFDGAGNGVVQGLQWIHSDSRQMNEMITRFAEPPDSEAASGWNYTSLKVRTTRFDSSGAAASVGPEGSSVAELARLYTMVTRSQLYSKLCNTAPDVCMSIIKGQ